ncbi:hypothetical protein [Novosphingobium sp.]|uniref:hypothetical protein n=1 Tax=Novosphingobium sp. TaxID=1874826 RepID=UPI00261C14A8|nr:hypothetical protein [Novosphingobium sp.]
MADSLRATFGGIGAMAADAEHGVAPSLYPEMKSLAATALKLCGFQHMLAAIQERVFDALETKNDFFRRIKPVLFIEDLLPIFSGPQKEIVHEPFAYLPPQELEFLKRISANGRVTCKLLNAGEGEEFLYSIMVRIPTQPQIPNPQTINCEIEFHLEIDDDFEDLVVVDLVTWFDDAIDEKLIRRARTSYALLSST